MMALPMHDRGGPSRRAFLWLLIAATLVTGAAWGAVIPPFEGPDERAYYQGLVMPALPHSVRPPQLYIAFMKPFMRLAGRVDRVLQVKDNPAFRAASNRRGRINLFVHGRAEATSRRDVNRLWVFRSLTFLVWVASLILVFETAGLVSGQPETALLTSGLCLCLPGVSVLLFKVHPAAIPVLLGSAVYWTMIARALGRLGRAWSWIIGLAAAGMAPFSGNQAYFLLLLVPLGLVLLETTWRAKMFAAVAFLVLTVLALRLRLFAHVQGDLRIAIAPFLPSYPYHWWPSDLPSYFVFEFAPKLFFSFCGWLGQQSLLLPAPAYAAMAVAFGVALYGLAARVRESTLSGEQRRVAVIFVVGIGLTCVPILYTNVLTDRTAAAGYWLYASIAPIMIGLVLGWRSAVAVVQRSPRRVPVLLAALRRWSPRSGSHRWPAGVFAFVWVLNLLLLMAFVAPLYSPLDAEGLAAAVREEAADGEYTRATDIFRLAAATYPESTAVSRLVIDVPHLALKGADEPVFRALQVRLARGETLNNRADLMALARVAHMRQAFDPALLRAVAGRIANTSQMREPLALIRAQFEGDAPAADIVRAAGGGATPRNMHDDAMLEGYTVHRGGLDRNEVTVYFRPLRSWSGRRLWVHAYPEGSRDYRLVDPMPPAFDGWRSDALAWETFPIPSDSRYVLYAGVEVAHDLGPAYPIGAVDR
jgi:hypothetical protein